MPRTCLDPDWQPHKEFDDIFRRMRQVVTEDAVAFAGTLFRCQEPKYAVAGERLNGLGAKLNGGRWNPKGLAALYGSATPQIAVAEAYGSAGRYGFAGDDVQPRIIFAFEADLGFVLDLTDGRIRQRLRVSQATVLETDWLRSRRSKREAVTQAVGRAACLAGCQGLLVPTKHSRTQPNLVVFPGLSGVPERLKAVLADHFGADA